MRSIVVPLYLQVWFLSFQLPKVHMRFRNIKWKFFLNKQLISFKLYITLSSIMKSWTSLLHPAQDVNDPFVQHIHTVYATYPLIS